MNAQLEAESTLTDRYQTTEPEIVRRAFKLGKGGKVRYTVRPDDEVAIARAEGPAQADPVLEPFYGSSHTTLPPGAVTGDRCRLSAARPLAGRERGGGFQGFFIARLRNDLDAR